MKQKILLVDDDADDQLFFIDALNEINAEVHCEITKNGSEALNRLEQEPLPDMTFLDLNMPVMNGFDCLAELRKRDDLDHIPVIIYSTTSDHSTVKKTHELGANAFFKKPNDFPSMRTKLEELLQKNFVKRDSNHQFSLNEFSF